MTNEINKFNNQPEGLVVILILVIAITVFSSVVAIFIVPFVSAVVFTVLFNPIYKWLLQHISNNHSVSALITCVIFLVILLIPAYLLFHITTTRFQDFYRDMIPAIEKLLDKGSKSPIIQLISRSPFKDILSIEQINWGSIIQDALQRLTNFIGSVVEKTYRGVFGFVIDMLIILFTMFYLLVDGHNFTEKLRFLLPLKSEYTEMFYNSFITVSRATIKGTFIVGIIQGTVGALTLMIFGIEQWFLWGFVMMVIAIIPLIGPPIVLIPAAVYQLLTNNIWQGIGILFSSFVIVSAIDYIIRPRIVGKSAHIHDLIIFFTMLGGLALYGIWGVIIGPAVSAFVVSAIQIYKKTYFEDLKKLHM
jgi:predicted PurR-regulated permease PerM